MVRRYFPGCLLLACLYVMMAYWISLEGKGKLMQWTWHQLNTLIRIILKLLGEVKF